MEESLTEKTLQEQSTLFTIIEVKEEVLDEVPKDEEQCCLVTDYTAESENCSENENNVIKTENPDSPETENCTSAVQKMEEDPLNINPAELPLENQIWLPIKLESQYLAEPDCNEASENMDTSSEITTFNTSGSVLCHPNASHQQILSSGTWAYVGGSAKEIEETPPELQSTVKVSTDVTTSTDQSPGFSGTTQTTASNTPISKYILYSEILRCRHCQLHFPCNADLISHKKLIHAQTFACSLCKYKFVNSNNLLEHLDARHFGLRHGFKCNDCSKFFEPNCDFTDIEVHICKHNEEKPFPCHFEKCCDRFKTQQDLSNHLIEHKVTLNDISSKKNKKIKLGNVAMSSTSVKSHSTSSQGALLAKHMSSKSCTSASGSKKEPEGTPELQSAVNVKKRPLEEDPIDCEPQVLEEKSTTTAPTPTISSGINKDHSISDTSKPTASNNSSSSTDHNKALYCKYCKISFSNTVALTSHQKLVHTQTFVCSLCKNIFFRFSGLVGHLKITHANSGYKCNDCPKTFVTDCDYTKFEIHLIKHNNKNPFPCNYQNCFYRFKTKEDLQNHLIVHKASFCENCGYTFNAKENQLKLCNGCINKTTSVTPISPKRTKNVTLFSCNLCRLEFKKLYLLNLHEETHKKFVCHICEEKFSTESSLQCHMQCRHVDLQKSKITNDKEINDLTVDNVDIPVINISESKIPSDKSTSKTQNTVKTKKRKNMMHKCEYCDQEFRWLISLNAHVILNHKHNCSVCGESFKSQQELKTHLSYHITLLEFNLSKSNKNKSNSQDTKTDDCTEICVVKQEHTEDELS